MDRILLAIASTLLFFDPAYSCECVGYQNDNEMVREEINELSDTSVGLDGVVVSSSKSPLSGLINHTAIVRPTHIWFGDRQTEYHLQSVSLCDSRPVKGQRVRMVLRRVPEGQGFFADIRRLFWGDQPVYQGSICSRFAEAMAYPAMRQAVSKHTKGRHKVSAD